jgi:hypothetical protein
VAPRNKANRKLPRLKYYVAGMGDIAVLGFNDRERVFVVQKMRDRGGVIGGHALAGLIRRECAGRVDGDKAALGQGAQPRLDRVVQIVARDVDGRTACPRRRDPRRDVLFQFAARVVAPLTSACETSGTGVTGMACAIRTINSSPNALGWSGRGWPRNP